VTSYKWCASTANTTRAAPQTPAALPARLPRAPKGAAAEGVAVADPLQEGLPRRHHGKITRTRALRGWSAGTAGASSCSVRGTRIRPRMIQAYSSASAITSGAPVMKIAVAAATIGRTTLRRPRVS
jgi:hypothetical protein